MGDEKGPPLGRRGRKDHMKTIAIMNNKGGVGKTVTAINLADLLVREHGKRVVLVDCDGQMNLTRFYLPTFCEDTCVGTADILMGEGEIAWSDNLVDIRPDLRLLAGSSALYDLDLDAIRDGTHNVQRLRDFVDAAREDGEVDYMIFDCPPGFTLASVSALMAADGVIVPLTVDGFSIEGLDTMQRQLHTVRRTGVKLLGVLITQEYRSRVVRQSVELLRASHFPVFCHTIRRSVKVPESTMMREPLAVHAPKSYVLEDYRAFVRELIGEVQA